VIIAVLGIILFPAIKNIIIPASPDSLVPKACVEAIVKKNMADIMIHGTSISPQLFFRYNNITVEYVCYTSEWYKTCSMQKPMIKQSIEKETQRISQERISRCISQMEDTLKSKGYSVKTTGSKNAEISIIPDKIIASFNLTIGLEKDDVKTSIPMNKFRIEIDSNAYDIAMIASSIQNFEARYGDSDITGYMTFYPRIKVEKYKQSDGTKLYIITHRDSGEKLQFATRSLAWPPGIAMPITSTYD